MATITPVPISIAGVAVPFVAATSGGDTLAAGLTGGVTFHVRNASGSAITVTMAGAVNCSLGFLHNVAISCAVGDTEILVPASVKNPATNGNVTITYSAVTSLTVAAVSHA